MARAKQRFSNLFRNIKRVGSSIAAPIGSAQRTSRQKVSQGIGTAFRGLGAAGKTVGKTVGAGLSAGVNTPFTSPQPQLAKPTAPPQPIGPRRPIGPQKPPPGQTQAAARPPDTPVSAPQVAVPEIAPAPRTDFALERRQEPVAQPLPVAPTPTPLPTQVAAAAPSALSSAEAQREAIRAQLLGTIAPSAQELAIQRQIADLTGATRLGVSGLEGQGRAIPLSLIRGQQGLLQEQGQIQQQTLQQQLAIQQAARQAQSNVALAQLGFSNEDIAAIREREAAAAEAAATQATPFEFGGNLVRFNPATGQVETVSEGPVTGDPFTLGEGQQRFDAQGNLIAAGPEAATDPLKELEQQLKIQKLQQDLAGGGDRNESLSPNEMESLGIDPGQFGLLTRGQADDLLRSGRIESPAQKLQKDAEANARDKIASIDLILDSPGLSSSVGTFSQTRIATPFNQAARQEFVGAVNQLISRETLDSLIAAKAQGATFGALSDTEIAILERAATKIGSWIDTDALGNTVFKVSEKAFKAELNRIRDLTSRAFDNMTAEPATSVDELMRRNSDIRGEVESLRAADIPEQEILEYFQPGSSQSGAFSSDLSTSKNGSNVLGLGKITGFGSSLWEHGLDIDLKIGDPVPTPVSGTVEFVGDNGGFGRQVRITSENGNSVWLSHLDSAGVRVGDRITKGQVIGRGGNTGKTIKGEGGDGSHLDLTVKKPDGTFVSPREIARLLGHRA